MERNVSYDLEVHDDLPARPERHNAEGASVLEDQLKKIVAHPDHHAPRWARIGRYANGAAAAAAANTLRKRHGSSPEVEGWRFETRRIENGEATGLFAQYDASKVVPGKAEENAEKYREWKARQAEARTRRAEDKARREAEVEAEQKKVPARSGK